MTQQEKLERAKLYIDKLAEGINPLDGTRLPENDIVNNIRISRCFFFVSDILRQVIENGIDEPKKKQQSKKPFYLSETAKARLIPQNEPTYVKYITEKINSVSDDEAVTKLKATSVTSFLVEIGMLEVVQCENGKNAKLPTKDGESIGISIEKRQTQYGSYLLARYNESAQRFIFDNIDAIIEYNNKTRPKKEKKKEPDDIVWSPGLDAFILDLVSNNVPVYEIAERLHCSRSAVERRISKLLLKNE